jgi:hypothetical protein
VDTCLLVCFIAKDGNRTRTSVNYFSARGGTSATSTSILPLYNHYLIGELSDA